jgi:hypothetical protein
MINWVSSWHYKSRSDVVLQLSNVALGLASRQAAHNNTKVVSNMYMRQQQVELLQACCTLR